MLCTIYLLNILFSVVLPVQINYVNVPPAIRNNSNTPAILDCNYSVRSDDTDLVVKWYLKNEVVYQWIPPQKPQSLGPLKNQLDLEYKATDDPKSVYRAMKILNPTDRIEGEYKCFVSTFTDEDFSVKSMTVFVPERALYIEQKLADKDHVNFTCFASEVYPTPKLILYTENKSDTHYSKNRFPPVNWDKTVHSNRRVSVYIVATVPVDALDPNGTVVYCELRIPGTGYVKIQRVLYYSADLPNDNGVGNKIRINLWFLSTLTINILYFN